MNYVWILILFAYLLLAHFVGHYIGRKRDIGIRNTVFWSLLLSPVIGFFIARMSGRGANRFFKN